MLEREGFGLGTNQRRPITFTTFVRTLTHYRLDSRFKVTPTSFEAINNTRPL